MEHLFFSLGRQYNLGSSWCIESNNSMETYGWELDTDELKSVICCGRVGDPARRNAFSYAAATLATELRVVSGWWRGAKMLMSPPSHSSHHGYDLLDVDTKLPEQLKLGFVSCRSEEKPAALLCLLRHAMPPGSQTVIFVATKHHVEYLHLVSTPLSQLTAFSTTCYLTAFRNIMHSQTCAAARHRYIFDRASVSTSIDWFSSPLPPAEEVKYVPASATHCMKLGRVGQRKFLAAGCVWQGIIQYHQHYARFLKPTNLPLVTADANLQIHMFLAFSRYCNPDRVKEVSCVGGVGGWKAEGSEAVWAAWLMGGIDGQLVVQGRGTKTKKKGSSSTLAMCRLTGHYLGCRRLWCTPLNGLARWAGDSWYSGRCQLRHTRARVLVARPSSHYRASPPSHFSSKHRQAKQLCGETVSVKRERTPAVWGMEGRYAEQEGERKGEREVAAWWAPEVHPVIRSQHRAATNRDTVRCLGVSQSHVECRASSDELCEELSEELCEVLCEVLCDVLVWCHMVMMMLSQDVVLIAWSKSSLSELVGGIRGNCGWGSEMIPGVPSCRQSSGLVLALRYWSRSDMRALAHNRLIKKPIICSSCAKWARMPRGVLAPSTPHSLSGPEHPRWLLLHPHLIRLILDAAGISNTFIYSNLDPSARKINAAKFQKSKVSVMLVTDIAARGIDIPQLDVVINYSFPAKPKLFVHRIANMLCTGRCARAGRSGVAFSLLSGDEQPYLLDLYLFLGRSLMLHRGEKSWEQGEWPDGVVGVVPLPLLEEEHSRLLQWHCTHTDLARHVLVFGLATTGDRSPAVVDYWMSGLSTRDEIRLCEYYLSLCLYYFEWQSLSTFSLWLQEHVMSFRR
ncbi:hypothetical protein PR048_001769 [Dryococelus australis]|uniref:Helicase C-terminal domain-containing protein n=1 Tax=Dryococelus australis TaxID=614101 RepID=A0ABQ9IJR2_9NEOP|nr:hypothetical protein PR048_001769 [Dryococelus australis]